MLFMELYTHDSTGSHLPSPYGGMKEPFVYMLLNGSYLKALLTKSLCSSGGGIERV